MCSPYTSHALCPPSNNAISDVKHYMVHLNGTNIINETHTSNETSILATYPVCSCASYNISVHIVDRCRYVGQSTLST